MRRSHTLALLIIVSAIMVSAGLWPFRFSQENNVHWIQGGKGLRFANPGIAFIRLSSDNTLSPLPPGKTLTIEFNVVPEEEPNQSIPHLLTFCDGEGNQLLAVGQWKSALIIRSASPGQYLSKAYSETGASKVLLRQRPVYIAIVSRDGDAVIYAGGKFAKERRGFSLFRQGDVSPSLIVVGNSSTGKSPWKGDFLYLAIHDGILSQEEIAERYSRLEDQGIPKEDPGPMTLMEYTFEDRDGDIARNRAGEHFPLSIPRSFRPIKMILLELPDPKELLTRSNIIDIFINIVGFIPFGFLVIALRKTNLGYKGAFRMIFLLILAGGVFSLCIEILQAFLPNRSSSLLDVITNVLGTLIGGALAFGSSRKEGVSLKRSVL